MIPTDLPLPRTSSNVRMSQREKEALAEQWYSMMIKEDIDSQHDISSIMSTMTQSVSANSHNDQQEQRDPNPRGYHYSGDRLLEKNVQIRDTSDAYHYRRSVSNHTPTNRSSKTDFLDGIIQSLSELSKAEKNSESKSILQEKKNGWSIQDSQRRIQERRSQLQAQERNASAGASYNYRQQNIANHGERSRQAPNPYGPLSSEEHPVAHIQRSASRQRLRMVDESDGSELSSSNYRSYSSGNSRSREYSSGNSMSNSRSQAYSSEISRSNSRSQAYSSDMSRSNSRSQAYSSEMSRSNSRSGGYSSEMSRSEGYSSGSRASHRSTRATPMEDGSSTSSFRKERSWNIDKSLKSNRRSLFDLPTSPISNKTPEGPELILPIESTSSLGSDKFHSNVVAPAGNRRPVSRDRTTSLASSSSKDAGRILQHFTMSTSSGSVDGAVDDSVAETLDDERMSKSLGESYPSRSRSNSAKKIRGSSSHSSRSNKVVSRATNDERMPKTSSQKELQREILRDIGKEAMKYKHERDLQRSNQKVGNALNDFEAVWGRAENREPSNERNAPKNEERVSGDSSQSNLFRQLTSCNAPGQEFTTTKMKFSPFLTTKVENNNGSEHERRIQYKLDAVRDESLRIFERSGSDNQEKTSRNGSSHTNEAETSSSKKLQGKKLENLFDINTDVLEELAVKSDPLKNPSEKHNISTDGSEINMAISPAIVGRNDFSHFKYVAYSQFGEDAQKVLKLCEHHTIPIPDRRKGEILIKILASTISTVDCAIRRGEWKNMRMDPYIIPGTAFVGKTMGREKKKLRPSSSTIDPGDNVLCLVRSGANARYISMQKNLLIKVHPKLQPERVVCLAETYLTAFQALHLGHKGGIRYRENSLQGQSILIMNAYSPVGKAIIELSRLGGASMCYGLVNDDSDDSKDPKFRDLAPDIHQRFKLVEEWGAIPLPANPQEWLTLIGRQIDILITSHDPYQVQKDGNGRITADHWKALKKEGQVHAICTHPNLSEVEQRNLILGKSSSNKVDMKAFRVPSCRPGGKQKMADRAVFYNLFDSWEGDRLTRVMARNDLIHLLKLLEADLVNPEILERVPLSKIAKAQRTLDLNKVSGAGHLICSPWMQEKPKERSKLPITSAEQESQGSKKYEI